MPERVDRRVLVGQLGAAEDLGQRVAALAAIEVAGEALQVGRAQRAVGARGEHRRHVLARLRCRGCAACRAAAGPDGWRAIDAAAWRVAPRSSASGSRLAEVRRVAHRGAEARERLGGGAIGGLRAADLRAERDHRRPAAVHQRLQRGAVAGAHALAASRPSSDEPSIAAEPRRPSSGT